MPLNLTHIFQWFWFKSPSVKNDLSILPDNAAVQMSITGQLLPREDSKHQNRVRWARQQGWNFQKNRPAVMLPAHSPPRAAYLLSPIRSVPLCFSERPWRTLKSADFQSLKTEANTKQSHQSERATDRESERDRESLIRKEQDIRVENKKKEKPDRPQHTLTHTSTHTHTHRHDGALASPLCCGWRTALRALGLRVR